MTNLTEALTATIRAEMARRRLPLARLAPVLGVSTAGVSRRMTGHTPFTVDELFAIAELLGIDVAELLQPRSLQLLGATA